MFDEQPLPEFGSASYPEVGTVDHNLLPEGCVVNYIDRQFVPGKLYHDRDNHRAKMKKGEVETTYDPGIWRNMRDPEGLASTFPAIVTALLGMLFGGVLRADDLICSKSRKLRLLFGYGALLVLIGLRGTCISQSIRICGTARSSVLSAVVRQLQWRSRICSSTSGRCTG